MGGGARAPVRAGRWTYGNRRAIRSAPFAPPPPSGGAAASAVLERPSARAAVFGQYEVQPMSVMRQKIAEHMVLSKRVLAARLFGGRSGHDRDRDAAREAKEIRTGTGTKLTLMPFFVRAAVKRLRAFPTVNASVDGTHVVLHEERTSVSLCALDWGDRAEDQEREERIFSASACDQRTWPSALGRRSLSPTKCREHVFRSRTRRFGGLFGLPVINQPNVAILGLGAIEKRPVVVDDAIGFARWCI